MPISWQQNIKKEVSPILKCMVRYTWHLTGSILDCLLIPRLISPRNLYAGNIMIGCYPTKNSIKLKKKGIVIIACLLCVTTFAQQQFAVNGTVSAADEPLVNATVTLAPSARKKLSNDNGYFRFARLVPGNYQLTVSAVGYALYQKDIVLK